MGIIKIVAFLMGLAASVSGLILAIIGGRGPLLNEVISVMGCGIIFALVAIAFAMLALFKD